MEIKFIAKKLDAMAITLKNLFEKLQHTNKSLN